MKIFLLGAILSLSLLAVATAQTEDQKKLDPHPVVALTFDDLPVAGSLPPGMNRTKVATELVAKLKAAQMEGSYAFVIGSKIAGDPDAEQAMHIWLDAGMNIGSHTWTHPSLTETTAESYMNGLAKNEAPLEQYGQLRDWRWFRYPYLYEGDTLAKRHAVRQWLFAHHYRIAEVTLDFEDWAWNDAYGRCLAKNDAASLQWLHDSYLQNAAEFVVLGREEEKIAFGHEIPNVLLLHATAFTTHMLPELIAQLQREGFRFASLAEVESDPVYTEDPDTALEFGGTLPDQFMDARHLPYPKFTPQPKEKLNSICQ
jgi:peptidoglycan/xylan/chitin deacetylase (PgdA/CDA1 family)